ncbi:Probable sugar phosphate/phosphate translocator At1g12500 [Linum grandiflorum]
MNLLLYMAPMAAMILLPFTLYIEGNVAAVTLEKAKGDPYIVFLLVGNATVAYLVNLTNFLVTKHTSALTLQVLGNAKAAVAAVVSVLIFRNPPLRLWASCSTARPGRDLRSQCIDFSSLFLWINFFSGQ